jgi:urea transport system permease protein
MPPREERSMSATDIFNITLMQGFAGLSLFSVLLLMGLGLAVIFGQMGVINMAHGEFMTIGAYTIYLFSWFRRTSGRAHARVFLLRDLAAFALAFAAGWLAEWALIRHLYKRPLDTLLATWGLSLGMQQVFRSTFGPKEVSPTLPDWLMGSWEPTPGLDIPVNGLFVMGCAADDGRPAARALSLALGPARARHGANRPMANAAGINTRRTDRMTFAIGCGIAGVAGAAFTTIGSTGPTSGSLYIVDSFLVVTFGGAASLLGTVASAFGIAQMQSISEFFLSGSMARVLTLLTVVVILMLRPQGLFASKVRRVSARQCRASFASFDWRWTWNPSNPRRAPYPRDPARPRSRPAGALARAARRSGLAGIVLLALLIVVVFRSRSTRSAST